MDNKDYIINIRVSRATYEKIKAHARDKKDTVSGLLRKTIEDSADIMRDLSHDLFGKSKTVSDIESYHTANLAKDVACKKCNRILAKGDSVTVGETSKGKRYYFCLNGC